MTGVSTMLSFFRKKHEENPLTKTSIPTLIDGLQQLCAGDLTTRVVLSENDPLSLVAKLINQYSEQNVGVLTKMSMVLNEVVYSGLKGGDRLNQLSLQSHQQAGNIEQVAVAVTQLAESVNNLAESTSKTSEQTALGKTSMELTSQSVLQVSTETEGAKDNLTALNSRVSELHTSTARIDELVAVVKGIAGQTNLLALNAAIEAARAGEHGRGFSVVAEEVRKLADQSGQSVGEITRQLNGIRSEVEKIQIAFNDIGKSFKNNSDAVASADESVSQLTDVFNKIGDAVQNLAPIAEEQSATFEEISATIRDLSTRTAELNDTSQLCNKDILAVLVSANAIRTEVSGFRIPFSTEQTLDLAKTDHLMWKARVTYMLRGLMTLNEANVRDHHACRLGKWYFGEGKKMFGHFDSFQKLDAIHEEFHTRCAEAISHYKLGNIAQSQQLAEEIENLSNTVLGILDDIKVRANVVMK